MSRCQPNPTRRYRSTTCCKRPKKKGYHTGGFPARGYKAERVQIGVKRNGEPRWAPRWVPDPSTAHLARRAWEMRAAGASYMEIQQATGLYKGRNCWQTFFRNRSYLGIIRCGDLEVPDAHEPLCTPEQWAAVRALMQKGNIPRAWSAKSPYLLTGIVVCGYCGAACSGGTDTGAGAWGPRTEPWRYYVCGQQKRKGWTTCRLGKIKAQTLERAVVDKLFEEVLTRDYLELLLDQVRQAYGIDQLEKDLVEARATLEELERAIGGIVDAIEQRSSSALMARLATRERERDKTLARVAALEIRRRRYADVQFAPGGLDALIDRLQEGLRSDHAPMSDTLRRVVTKIEVQKDRGTLYVKAPCAVLSVGTPGGVLHKKPHNGVRNGRLAPQLRKSSSSLARSTGTT